MKIVLVGGCFDILHFGHISFLTQAKKLGDELVVLLESDETIRRLKGKTRPIHTQTQRKDMLEALSVVDRVICLDPLHSDKEYEKVISEIHPTVIAATEGDPILGKKEKQAESLGVTLVVIGKIHTPSTSQLTKLLGLE